MSVLRGIVIWRLPTYEKRSARMFSDLRKSFQKGLKNAANSFANTPVNVLISIFEIFDNRIHILR